MSSLKTGNRSSTQEREKTNQKPKLRINWIIKNHETATVKNFPMQ